MRTSEAEIQKRFAGSAAIAVIGVGCLFPDAENAPQFWDNILRGKDSIGPIPLTHWRPEDYYDEDPKRPDFTYAKTGGFLQPYLFDPLQFGLAPHALEATDTTQLLGMVAAHQALVDAGYGPDRKFDRDRVACLIGVTGTLELVIPLGARLGHPIWKQALQRAGIDPSVSQQVLDDVAASYVSWQENSFPGLLGNVVAGRIANRFDLGGSNSVVDAACASSLAALHMAMMELESGRADMVISGGMDTFNDIFMYMCFSKTPALSPTGHSRPFDAEGDGTILGEGLGAVILKRLDDAVRDGDRIYAVLRGIGSSSDGKGQAIYAPSSSGQMKALQRAYEKAGVSPKAIGLLEAHGTGTKVGDGVELEALKQVFGPTEAFGPWCQLGSVKSQIGHTKAAAGAAGLIKALMALHHKVLPPTLKVSHPHPKLEQSPFVLDDKARPWISIDRPRIAAVSAFGFGGSNYHCVLEEFATEKTEVVWDPEVHVALFSAADQKSLLAKVDAAVGQWKSAYALDKLLRLWRQNFSVQDSVRLGIFARGKEAFSKLLDALVLRLQKNEGPWPQGAFFAEGIRKGKLGFIFAGQGSQTPGMLRDLACRFPEFHQTLTEGEKILRRYEGDSSSLQALIYPARDFSPDSSQRQQERLTATRYAQLSLGTMGLGLLKTLRRFGIEGDIFAGHSYGELLALYAAGSWDESQLLEASYARGKWMSEKAIPGGGMLAVMAPASVVEDWLSTANLDVSIANRNAPEQLVLGGSLEAIEQAQKALRAKRISCKKLEVSSAFHTRYVQDAVPYFRDALGHWPLKKTQRPVLANVNADFYPDDPQAMREILAEQIGSPVRFVELLSQMEQSGVSTVVEIGPGRKLQGLLRSGLSPDIDVLSLDSQPEASLHGLIALLLQLSVQAYSVKWEQWAPGPIDWVPPKARFLVPISGANYRAPTPPRPEPVKPLVSKPETMAVSQEPVKTTPVAMVKQPLKSPAVAKPMLTPRAVDSAPSFLGDAPVTKLEDSQKMQKLLHDMQDLQRRTTEAHTLFLENQRQFQNILRQVLTQGTDLNQAELVSYTPSPSVHSEEQRPVAKPMAERSEKLASAPVREATVPTKTSANPAPAKSEPRPKEVLVKAPEAAKQSLGRVTAVLARTTGYPEELLQDNMSLEGDLGIDSIKRVEILSQLQGEFPELQADPAAMSSLQTVGELRAACEGTRTTEASPLSKEDDRIGAWSAGQVAFASSINSEGAGTVLDVLADKTGFPREMLQASMDLEGDLGIDSIKKVEIFSALQEKILAYKNLTAEKLQEARTIADLQSFAHHPNKAHAESVVQTAVNVVSPSLHDQNILRIVAEKTGYPQEVLQAEMDLEADLGIDSIKRVEIISALTEVLPSLQAASPESLAQVKTLGDLTRLAAHEDSIALGLLSPEVSENWDLSEKKGAQPLAPVQSTVLEELSAWTLSPSPFTAIEQAYTLRSQGDVWIVDDGSNLARNMMLKLQERGQSARLISLAMQDRLAIDGNLQGLFLLAPTKFDLHAHRWFQQALKLLRRVGETLQANRGFLITVTRNGGQFGLDGLTQLQQVFAGGVSAFAKTVSHEWPEVHTRALDLAKDFVDGFEAAQRCLEGAFVKGPLELGVASRQFWQLLPVVQELSHLEEKGQALLEEGALVLVTGGARGVTAATLRPLAARYKPHFVIWGRTPLSTDSNVDWHKLEDAAGIKRALMEKDPALKHPRALEQAYRLLVQQKEIAQNIEGLEILGAKVSYQVVDVSRETDLKEACETLVSKFGVPTAIIHGAGVIRDKFILDQKDEEFFEVLDTKLRILPWIDQWSKAGLSWVSLFSSSTARLGRKGQVAYGVANEILNKSAAYLQSLGLKAVAFNWGPWDGGMVQENLKKLFAAEGIGTIPLAAGAELMRAVLESKAPINSEWIVLAAGSEIEAKAEQSSDSIVDTSAVFEVSVSNSPILLDHVLKHRAVVPAALLLEWMAVEAQKLVPALTLERVEEFTLWKGVVLDVDQVRRLKLVVKQREDALDGSARFELELISADASDAGRAHARAQMCFRPNRPGSLGVASLVAGVDPRFSHLKLYEDILFHGESLAYLEPISQISSQGLALKAHLRGRPQEWSEQGLQDHWISHAPLLDAVFQAAIVWSHVQLGLKCLPNRIHHWHLADGLPLEGEVQLRLQLEKQEAHSLRFQVQISDPSGEVKARLDSIEMVMDASLAHSFVQNRLLKTENTSAH